MRLEELRLKLNSISVYRNLLEDKLINSLHVFLERLFSGEMDLNGFARHYNLLFFNIINIDQQKSFREYIIDLIISDENPFSMASEKMDYENINNNLVKAASNDLRSFGEISMISSDIFKEYALQHLCTSTFEATVASGFPEWGNSELGDQLEPIKELLYKNDAWDRFARDLSTFYRANGTGMFSRFRAFIWERGKSSGSLRGIDSPDPIMLSDFIGYESERLEIIKNTEQFLKGFTANNMLLYGDRGTGKSSTVKALVNEYWQKGLRIVEVPKNNLADFPQIIMQLKDRKQRFIIFIDDLAFEDDEENYTSLKAVLEGGLQSRPGNVVIYATSNRRHLIKEKFSDRLGLQSGNADDEIRSQDTIQEKLSLADRFGITIVFSSPDKSMFLEIVEGLADKRGIGYDKDKLYSEALKWEIWYNGRSPRTARQFVDWLEGNSNVVC
ncbi:ATP-binding protein [Acetivibrio cellulolyticus]|uniref:ATP-binding protein n=1 Tax=Acetivibrio cellulolyticus TaxID=35830 RepID=UPI0001E2D44A|nr:ATP-binding protein [Acetivibrio cellulolyticus]